LPNPRVGVGRLDAEPQPNSQTAEPNPRVGVGRLNAEPQPTSQTVEPNPRVGVGRLNAEPQPNKTQTIWYMLRSYLHDSNEKSFSTIPLRLTRVILIRVDKLYLCLYICSCRKNRLLVRFQSPIFRETQIFLFSLGINHST